MTSGGLSIRTLEAQVHHTGDAARGLAARAAAQEILQGPLPHCLGKAAGALQGEGVAVVDRLEIAVSLIADEANEQAAVRWAQAIMTGLRRALLAPDQSYSDGAEHLACYLEAVLSGQRSAPAFHAFAGFAAMPQGMAIRAALCKPGAVPLPALLRLAPRTLRAVLSSLSDADAALILQAIAMAEADARLCIALSPQALAEAIDHPDTAVAVLYLVVSGAAKETDRKSRVLPETALQFVHLYRRSLRIGAPTPGEANADRDPPGITLDGAGGEICNVLQETLRSAIYAPQPALPARWVSQAAGFGLLVPVLIALTEEAGVAGSAPPAARLRFDLLATAAQGRIIDTDPVLRCLAGVPAQGDLPCSDPILLLRLADVMGAADASVETLALEAISRFTAGIKGFETATAGFVIDNFLSTPGSLAVTPDRLILRYQPPPLLIALVLAGCARMTCNLPWCPGVHLDLAPRGAA